MPNPASSRAKNRALVFKISPSILPYEDCCTIFTPPHPKTKPTLAEIEAAEAAMPGLAGLEETAAREVERIRIEMEPPRRGGALFEL